MYIHLIFCFAVCSLHTLAFLYPIFCLSAFMYFCFQSFVYLSVCIFVSNLLFICLYLHQFCSSVQSSSQGSPCHLVHYIAIASLPFSFFLFPPSHFFSILTDLVRTFSPFLFCPLHYNRLSPIFIFFFTYFFFFAHPIFFSAFLYT